MDYDPAPFSALDDFMLYDSAPFSALGIMIMILILFFSVLDDFMLYDSTPFSALDDFRVNDPAPFLFVND